ncbi:MAG: hypothetical protein OER92_02480 [Alphaproteobacteria bacterium]|nr:hypothetical protein [Alphaproteobacteria bacterium]
MQLAEKQDMTADKSPSDDDTEPTSLVVYADKPKASPAASLSANLIPRRHDSLGGVQVAELRQQAAAQAAPPRPEPVVEPIAHAMSEEAVLPPAAAAMPDMSEAPESPIGARAQQAILNQAFDELEPVTATSPIERSEFTSARESAAHWSLRSGPSSSYLERIIRDISIFTIFFAVLVFAILQTM